MSIPNSEAKWPVRWSHHYINTRGKTEEEEMKSEGKPRTSGQQPWKCADGVFSACSLSLWVLLSNLDWPVCPSTITQVFPRLDPRTCKNTWLSLGLSEHVWSARTVSSLVPSRALPVLFPEALPIPAPTSTSSPQCPSEQGVEAHPPRKPVQPLFWLCISPAITHVMAHRVRKER